MSVRSSSHQLVIVCTLLAVAISGLFFLDRASANSDLATLPNPETSGGPDLFGYTFLDSNEAGGPVYAWEEISNTGTLVTGWNDYDDGYASPIPIGFTFNYYGTDFTELYVNTNGYISFGYGYPSYPTMGIPNINPPNDDIGLFGENLFLDSYGTVTSIYYQTLSNPTRLVLEFVDIFCYCSYNDPITFEVILYASGDILSQYATLVGASTNYVGIENSDGTDGLGYGATLADNLAIRYYYPSGILLAPASQQKLGDPGSTVPFVVELTNLTGAPDSFDLEVLPGNAWTTTLSSVQVGPIAYGESITFTAWVDVPVGALPGDNDTATIQATSVASPTVTASASISTYVLGEEIAYVTLMSGNLVSLVDVQSQFVVGSIDTEPYGCISPWRATMSPDEAFVYVGCFDSGSVLVIDTQTKSVVTNIPGIPYADDIAFTHSGAYALVGTRWSDQITVIDTASLSIAQTIMASGYVRSIEMHSYLDRAYATSGNGAILVIDTNTFTIIDSIPVSGEPWDVAVSPDGAWVYAGNRMGVGVWVIDASTNSLYTTIAGVGGITGLEVSSNGAYIYAGSVDSSVSVIDAVSFTPVMSATVNGPAWEMALTCDNSQLYVGDNSNEVAVIDALNFSVGYIPMPAYSSRGIAICPQPTGQGAFITPSQQNSYAEAGETITYTMQMVNATGVTDSFDLEVLPGNTWTTTLSSAQVGPIADGESISFTAWVEVSPGALAGESDSTTIQATSVTSPTVYTSTATLTTRIPIAGLAYIPMSEANSLALVDIQTYATYGTVDLAQYGCSGPRRARLTPDGAELYITCEDTDNILVLSTSNFSLVAVIDRPLTCMQDVTFVQAGAYALASSSTCGTTNIVDVIDTTSHTIIQSILMADNGLVSIDAHPYLPVAYAGGFINAGIGELYIIDTNTFTIIDNIEAGYTVNDVRPSPDGMWIYASATGYGVLKIDASNNTIVDYTPLNTSIYGLETSLDGSKLFVSTGGNNSVLVVETESMEIFTSFYVGPTFESELTCDGSKLFVAKDSPLVSVIDTVTFGEPDEFAIPGVGSGYGIAICPPSVLEGVFLSPAEQTQFSEPGNSPVYSMRLANLTGETDIFNLEVLPGNTWTTTLSTAQVGPIADGEFITFTAWVDVPANAQPGDSDTAIIQATSVTSPTVYTSTATLNTIILGEEKAYVTLQSSNLIAVVDVATQIVVDTIQTYNAGCQGPWRASLSPDRAFVYIGCFSSNSVLVIDTGTNSVVTNISGIPTADDIAFTPSGDYALVGSRWSSDITVIDTATFSIYQTIINNGYTHNLAMHPSLALAYATSGSGEITVIDTTTFAIVNSIYVGGNPWDVALSPDGAWLFASDRDGSGLWVIDTSTNSLYTTVIGVGELTGLEVSGDGAYVYAGGWYGEVWIIDASTFLTITSVPVNNAAWEPALTCDGSQLYVGNASSQVAVIETASFSLAGYIDMPGDTTRGIAMCPENMARGISLDPSSQAGDGGRGETVTYQETLYNNSGITDTFYLEGIDYLWDTQLSVDQVGPLQSGESASFSVTVTVPPDAAWYTSDSVTIIAYAATTSTLSAQAEIVTTAYAPAQISIEPDSLESTQPVGEFTTHTLNISNGEGVTLTYDVLEGTYPGQVAFLKLDEPFGSNQFHDQSGFDNNATCSGDTCPEAGVPGMYGTALNFDGIDDYIEIAHSPEFDEIEDQDKLSIAAWVWIDDLNNTFKILHQGTGWEGWSFEVNSGGVLFYSYFMQDAYCIFSFNIQEWYHVAISYDRSQELQLYVNGNPICNGVYDIDVYDTQDAPMYIGYGPFGEEYADGKIDELNIFNRAISTEEVTELYQGGLSGDTPWLSVDPDSGSVPTGGTAPVAVNFDATGLQPDVYTATLSITSNDPLQPLLTVPVTLTVVAEQAGVSITPAEAAQTGSPGETIAYTLTLTNLGNTADSFSLEATGAWTTTLSAGSTGELAPGETFTFVVYVTVPLEAQVGDQDLAVVTATSENDATVSAEAQITSTCVVTVYQTALPLVYKK
jgi:YVTN family beta-propeller protein